MRCGCSQALVRPLWFCLNTLSTQEFVKDLDGGLCLSSVLEAFPCWVYPSHAQLRGEPQALGGNIYSTMDSPSSELSSLRFPPYPLVLTTYIFWWPRPGRSDCVRNLDTPVLCHSVQWLHTENKMREEKRKHIPLRFVSPSFAIIFICTINLLLVTFQKGGLNSENCFG